MGSSMIKPVQIPPEESIPQRGPRGRPLSDAEKARIQALRTEGRSILAISNEVGRSTAAVWKALALGERASSGSQDGSVS